MEKFLFPILIVVVSLSGGLIPIRITPGSNRFELMLNISAGVIIGVAFFHMLPESIQLIDYSASYFTASGFLLFFLIERFITIHHCEIDECEEHGVGIPAFIGFSIHNFFDGVALGASMLVPKLSFLTFLAIILHKAPMAFALSTVLLKDGYSRLLTVILGSVFALIIPVGTIVSYFFLNSVSMTFAGYALAFSAGSFIYIALGDIVPHLHNTGMPKVLSTIFLMSGIIIMLIAKRLLD